MGDAPSQKTGLTRELGLLGLAATGICSMLGAAINVVPIMIQRSVPGIGPYVLHAYLYAAIPAILAGPGLCGPLVRHAPRGWELCLWEPGA